MTATFSKEHLPLLLLAVMFILMLTSSWNDSAIIDELAHIPAAYSYVFLQDARLNPEHPPLIKDLAALPLLFYKKLNFPTDVKSWTEDINGQWTQGAIFLYEAGNDADAVIRLMRLPIMLLALFFGWMLWAWARRHFGPRVALGALFFYTLSPTFITHSRFVTTDLAAAFGFFIGIVAFVRFLKDPSLKNIVLAGLAFGIAQLLKFSLILLIPVYGVLLVAWAAAKVQLVWRERLKLFLGLTGKTILLALVAVVLIWVVYLYHVWNYPPDRQLNDAEFILTSFRFRSWVTFDLWLIQNPVLRPLGQYFLGLFMVLQRAAGGNTQYFLGEVTAAGSRIYFPALYLLKEPLAFHILSLIALFFALKRVAKTPEKSLQRTLAWLRDHFLEFASLTFVAIYWLSSISSTLNIGVRHVLPTFPFLYVLVSKEMVAWLRSWRQSQVTSWWEWLGRVWQIYVASLPRYLLVTALVLWQGASVLTTFPHFLPYYNELGGGTEQGYRIAADSNYDWGQDLKRLRDFVEENNIANIALDYFGGGSPRYYFGDAFEPWQSSKGYPPGGGWFAVSATFQMGAYGTPIQGFIRRPEDSYEWLKPFRPVARGGKSIFIYRLPERFETP
ncbi:MAG: glycosyltransferase family 39 protein [Candidatus Sungbacteria bacterium]|uniref:Glycosyltransferase family 39 protein n=1 Tax=Candidatus Sungiibacteriota bacterium TaxID=2750080 RepID=A0A932YWU8_9BACT|nr:glycosyltransferase family 39 protein [Candidatus Sungbacteria bacterium]